MRRRRKWIMRSLLAVAAVLTLTAAVGYWALTGTPDYYRRPAMTSEERADAANRAIDKFRQGREWANDVWVSEQRSINAAGAANRPAGATNPTTRSANPFTVAFSEQELNAFFDEWSREHWDARYGKYVKDPAVILRDGRLILAGTLNELGAVASFHFHPAIDRQGRLNLSLEGVRAGRLPMPEVVYAAQRDRLLAEVEERLPAWQKGAAIAPNGVANDAAVAAHMCKLLVDVLHRRPREPVLFLPFDGDGRAVPVRLTDVRIADGELTLSVQSLNSADRAALLEDIREPAAVPLTASVE